MEIVWIVLFCIALLAALIATAFGLPGTFVVVLAVLTVGIASGFTIAPVWLVLVLLVLAILTEVLDAVLSAWAVKRFEGTGRGQIGAVFLGLAGALLGGGISSVLSAVGIPLGPVAVICIFVVGPIVGGCAGGFAGAVLGELSHGRPRSEAIRAGWGAFIGRTLGTIAKIVVCTIMAGVAAYTVVPGLLGTGEGVAA